LNSVYESPRVIFSKLAVVKITEPPRVEVCVCVGESKIQDLELG